MLGVAVVAMAIFAMCGGKLLKDRSVSDEELALFEPVVETQSDVDIFVVPSTEEGYTEVCERVINDIELKVFIPHNASMSLCLDLPDREDRDIIYAAQAADIRSDNGQILGAFVLEGKPLAWGLSKRGFCASIGGKVTVGVADNSPLFEQATEQGGYFFRQYGLVQDGVLVENNPKGKSYRKAICDYNGQIMMVESRSQESFHDFAQALVDMGVDQAVYLVGSYSYSWAYDKEGVRHDFGNDRYFVEEGIAVPQNITFMVWRKNSSVVE